MKKHHRDKKGILVLAGLAAMSFVWIIIRSGRKPSRIAYPCQRAAAANIHIFLLALFTPILSIKRFRGTLSTILDWKHLKGILLITSLALASGILVFPASQPPLQTNYSPVQLNFKPQNAQVAAGSSSLFIIDQASGTNGNMDTAMNTLISLMSNHSLSFFKTGSQPSGLIGKNDVVLLKANSVGPERAGTNTDLIKSLISKILAHPEGFIGEIVVADNGQGTGGLNLAESNAYDHAQSMQDVAGMFSSYKVSACSWYPISSTTVNEYNQGDLTDGYLVNATENPITHLKVSYAKFRTAYGTYISFKKGIWNTATSSYDSSRLKIINMPILKSHYNYGVTACVKNYMGVGSQTLTDCHDALPYGAMGTSMVQTRFPTLNILDSIWVNANPVESGSECGPPTTYEAASYTNTIGASIDPVALEYWSAKNILIPAAIEKGYTEYQSLNPDYAAIAPELTESYHNYLERSMTQLKNAGYQATMTQAEMNVYVAHATYVFADGFESGNFNSWTGTSLTSGETATITTANFHHGMYASRLVSDGEGGYERACVYETLPALGEVYTRGYFYVSQSGIVDDNDRFFLITLRANNSNLAYAGWRRSGGATKWILTIRDGTTYVDVYSSSSPTMNQWYCVELHWKEDAAQGLGELWIDGVKVCSTTAKNTANYGTANQMRVGLAETYECAATTVYADCVRATNSYIGQEPAQTIHDIAVTSLTIEKNIVCTGFSVRINVTVTNQGDFVESFNATLYRLGKIRKLTLRGSATTGWNSSIPGPTITLDSQDSILLKLTGADSTSHRFFVDYNGDSVPSSGEPASPIFTGSTISYAFVANRTGSFTYYCSFHTSTMHGSLLVNPIPTIAQISSQRIAPPLSPGSSHVFSFVWNTAGLSEYQSHTLQASATVVSGETQSGDNTIVDSLVTVVHVGDVTNDFKVDIQDLARVSAIFGSFLGRPNWNPIYDVNGDQKVDIQDVARTSGSFGWHI